MIYKSATRGGDNIHEVGSMKKGYRGWAEKVLIRKNNDKNLWD